MKTATTIDEQIHLLLKRGMQINNIATAKDVLLDIGYYRLGFYWYPFEENVKGNRTHIFQKGTNFKSAVDLYYFDNDMRNVLLPYIQIVEVNFRNCLIYKISNKYKDDPIWFSNTAFVSRDFVANFNNIYNDIKKNPTIQKHHKKYPMDIYAPAWKTLEYATFGNITALYKALNDTQQQKSIAAHYNITNLKVFDSYLTTLRCLRNICAHGHTLYDMCLAQSIRKGPIQLSGNECHNVVGAIKVLDYFLQAISINKSLDLKRELSNVLLNAQEKDIYHLVSYIASIE